MKMIVYLINSSAAGAQMMSMIDMSSLKQNLTLFIFTFSYILSGSYHNFFKSFCRSTRQENMFECSRESAKPKHILKPKRIINNSNQNTAGNILTPATQNNNKRNKKDEINVDSLDFSKKILHTSWHPKENIIAIAATNNLYIFHGRENFPTFGESSPSISSINGVNMLQSTQSISNPSS